MPMPCSMQVEGETQGKIEGSCKIKGREGQIAIQSLRHKIEIPRSPQTGLPTGKRVHLPMTVTKEVDKSSPKLYQALGSGEGMKSVILDFYRINPKGQEEKYYTTKLENAIVVGISAWIPNCMDSEYSQFGHMEDVSFSYEKITETWLKDGIETQDSWLAPKA